MISNLLLTFHFIENTRTRQAKFTDLTQKIAEKRLSVTKYALYPGKNDDRIRQLLEGVTRMNEVRSPKKPLIFYYGIALLVIVLFNVIVSPLLVKARVTEVDYGTFMSMIEQKKIGNVEVDDDQIIFTDKDDAKKIYKTGAMNDPTLTQRLYDSGAKFSKDIETTTSPLVSFLLTFVLPLIIFIGLGQYMGKKLMEQAGGKNSMAFGFGKSNAKVYVPSTQGIHFSDVAGEDEAKESLSEIVDYLHNPKKYSDVGASMPKGVLLVGPPGTGKTMLASRINGLLPDLSNEEALESAAILSLVNAESVQKQWRHRPFRSPHHSASLTAMVGGGAIPGPGEISLAHNGVLFLDELPEFERRTLDALREPIESGQIHLSRTRAKITYPARFQLVAAMNPSPTGHYQGNHNRCTPEQTLRYLNRLSGPFLDRFDLSLEIPLPPPGILSKTVVPGENSTTVKQRVMAARERQFKRQNKLNAWLDNPEIRQFCKLESEDAQWLEETLIHLGLSIRAWQRLLKVARTIADIDQSDIITRQHLQEAVSYRAIDRLLIHLQKLLT